MVVVLVEQQVLAVAALELLILAAAVAVRVGRVAVLRVAQALSSFVTPDHSAAQAAQSLLLMVTQSIHLRHQEHTHHDYC